MLQSPSCLCWLIVVAIPRVRVFVRARTCAVFFSVLEPEFTEREREQQAV